MRKARAYSAIILILVGALLVLRPVGQWAYAWVEQHRLNQEVMELENPTMAGVPEEPSVPLDDDTDGNDQGDAVSPPGEEAPRPFYELGAVVGRIEIPKLGLGAVVLYGTDLSVLAKGPSLYPEANGPGEGGNMAIAAHRTTYGAWFRQLDRLEEGDAVIIVHEGLKYIYLTEQVFVVASNDWSVIAQTEYDAITLTSCHPPGSDRQRIVLRGRLAGVLDPTIQ